MKREKLELILDDVFKEKDEIDNTYTVGTISLKYLDYELKLITHGNDLEDSQWTIYVYHRYINEGGIPIPDGLERETLIFYRDFIHKLIAESNRLDRLVLKNTLKIKDKDFIKRWSRDLKIENVLK